MKLKKKLIISIFTIILLLITLFTSISFADEKPNLTTSAKPTTSSTNKVNLSKDLFICDNYVNIDTPVNGNAFIFAEEVSVNSKIQGNAFIFAKKVELKSRTYINSSAFILADNIILDGDVYDLYTCSNALTLTCNSRVLRSMSSIGQSLELYGNIFENANITFEDIKTSESTKIGGNLNCTSNSNIPKEKVSGSYLIKEFKETSKELKTSNIFDGLFSYLIVSTIIILIIVLAIPKFVEKEESLLKKKLLPSIGIGTAALFLIPIACFILITTIIGILPAISIIFAYIFTLIYVVSSIVSIAIAKLLTTKFNKNKTFTILMSILFVFVFYFVCKIPVLGNIISLFIAILGLGILINSMFKIKDTKMKNKTEIETNKK